MYIHVRIHMHCMCNSVAFRPFWLHVQYTVYLHKSLSCILRFTKHLAYRASARISRKFMYNVCGSAEKAMEEAHQFGKLFKAVLREYDTYKKKPECREMLLNKHSLQTKKTISDTRLELEKGLCSGSSPVFEAELKKMRTGEAKDGKEPMDKEKTMQKADLPAESSQKGADSEAVAKVISEGVFPLEDGFRAVFDAGCEQIVKEFATEEKANAYFSALVELRKNNALAKVMNKLKLKTATASDLMKTYTAMMHKKELQARRVGG